MSKAQNQKIRTGSKRNRLVVDENARVRKQQCFWEVIRVAGALVMVMYEKGCVVSRKDMYIGEQIGSAVYSIINTIKKVSSGSLDAQKIEHNITINMGPGSAVFQHALKDLATVCGAAMSIPSNLDERNLYFGTLMPVCELMTLYKIRFNEVRFGVTVYNRKSEPTGVSGTSIEKYGLQPEYATLLEGISYPPARRSAILQSLGSLAIAVTLIDQTDMRYKEKYAKVLANAISHLPMNQSIVEHFKNRGAEYKIDILLELGNILLLTGDRRSHRAIVPFSFFLNKHVLNKIVVRTEGMIDQADNEAGKRITIKTGSSIYSFDFPAYTEEYMFDATGVPAWTNYRDFAAEEWVDRFEGDVDVYAQLVFHAVFGTYYTAFNDLKIITGISNWKRRTEVRGTYGEASKKNGKKFKPITPLYASKLMTSLPCKDFAPSAGPLNDSPAFSGRCSHSYSRKLLDFVKETRTVTPGLISNDNTLLSVMLSYKAEVLLKISRNNDSMVFGTTEWKTLQNYIDKKSETVNLDLKGGGGNFFSAESSLE